MARSYRLIASCPDAKGIVAAISQFIAERGGWIAEATHHSDLLKERFYMRYEILADDMPITLIEFQKQFLAIAEKWRLSWSLSDSLQTKRVAIMVSKQSHCLSDILYRWRSGELLIDIPCIISNHEDLRDYVQWHGIPFYCIPIDKENKKVEFNKIMEIFAGHDINLIVLARYMQILPPRVCEEYSSKIINIHHSFLPSFIGSKPYHQAYERGVKLVGATCHYVTAELDAGPIIEQDVLRVGNYSSEKMTRLGKDVEKTVLARGLRYHVEDRVILDGGKTIILV